MEGSFKALGFPMKMRGTPQQVRFPPPLLGEHSREIREELVSRGLLDELARRRRAHDCRGELICEREGRVARVCSSTRAHTTR